MRLHHLVACVLFVACGDNLGGAPTDGRGSDAANLTDASGSADATSDSDGTNAVAPTVVSNLPANNGSGIVLDPIVSATFSEPMDRATLTMTTFTLAKADGAVSIPGAVVSTSTTIAFTPTAQLDPSTSYIATISTAAKSAADIAMTAPHSWMFRTGTTTTILGVPVPLGTSGNFVLLGMSGITNVPTSHIVGDIGVSPITSTAITGMPLTPDVSLQFATTPQVTGHIFAPDYAIPTPANLTTAVSDMLFAFTAAAGRAPDVTELGAGTIGSITLAPGVYSWSSALLIPTSITLSGSSTDVWIFQVAQDLTLSSGTAITLAGGALPKNIFWQVSGQLVVNTGGHLEGNVLSKTAATLDTGASLNGRLLAQTLVTVRGATITEPAP